MDKRAKRFKLKEPDSWSAIAIHQLMIKDKLRTLSYKRAIENNVKKNDIVLDVGCGTGILSFFAAKKRIKRVYAVDKFDIIDSAIETAKLNKLEEYCEFFKGDIFRFKPREKIDVLIHEQIGRFLWEEDLVRKIAYIRDNFLKKDGIIIPLKIDLCLAPTNYRSDLEKSLFFWSKRRYGIDFSNLCNKVFLQRFKSGIAPQIIRLKNEKTFLCKQKSVYTIDLWKEDRIPRKITASFRLKKGSKLRGMCAFFKVYLDEKNVFSTKPATRGSHWGQIFLPCIEEKRTERDSILDFTLFPKREANEWKFKFEIR